MLERLLHVDATILLWIQTHMRNEICTQIFTKLTHLGDAGWFWLVCAALLLWKPKTREIGKMAIIAMGFNLIVNNLLLKNIVARTRPYEAIIGLKCLIPAQVDFSFPSGHTGASFAAAVVFFRKLPKRYGIPALVLAVLISFSRLYVGVHYPSDVLAGALIGIMGALLSEKFCGKEAGTKDRERVVGRS